MADDQYTVKEYLAAMELRLTAHLDRLDHKLESKADGEVVRELVSRVGVLERTALTQDNVAKALQESKARGWTQRERLMGTALFLLTTATFVLNLLISRP